MSDRDSEGRNGLGRRGGHEAATRRPGKSSRCRALALAVLSAAVAPCAHAPAARAVLATRGVVAAEHGLASHAGVAVLQAGGNAVDAAAATAFAVCVLNPSSCGIGGGGFMLIYLARERRAVSLDFRETAPAGATRDMFVRDGHAVPELSLRGGLAVAVPGEVAGLAEAVRRYGRLTLGAVLEPAIRFARDGFPIEEHLAKEIAAQRDLLAANAETARIFLRADGSAPAVGDVLRQPDLAQTLERIAAEGPEAFYRGEIAGRIVAAVGAAGGVMTAADLESYRPRWREPLSGAYRDAQVYAMGPPSSGGGALLEVLGILRHDDLGRMGVGSPEYAHLLAESMQHAFADRARAYGDPDYVPVPLQRLLDPANTALLRRRLRPRATLPPGAYGSDVGGRAAAANDAGTSHLSVIDAEGNAVACTSTINTGFGSLVTAPGTGIVLNNEMDDFSAQPGVPNVYGLVGAEANAVAAGKRPLSSMTPTIATRDGRVVLVAGGSGGPLIISGTLQVLIGIVDFGLDASTAVGVPRLHHQWSPRVLMVEATVPASLRAALAGYGHSVREVAAVGAVQAISRQASGLLDGASDPRKGGEAAGW